MLTFLTLLLFSQPLDAISSIFEILPITGLPHPLSGWGFPLFLDKCGVTSLM